MLYIDFMEKKGKQIGVRIEPSLRNLLQDLKKKKGWSEAKAVRIAVLHMLWTTGISIDSFEDSEPAKDFPCAKIATGESAHAPEKRRAAH